MSHTHTINVSNPWYDYMKDGKKRVEGRLNKGTFKTLKKRDIIIFKNNNDNFKARIKKIVKYKSFEEYLSHEGLNRTLPGIDTIERGIAVYRKYYTEKDEAEYHILAIHIKVIDE